jgi:hypothetical protein
MAREDAHAVMHLHTPHGQAVAAHAEGLLPLTQTAMLVRGDLAFHDYEGVAVDLEERERLVADLGDKSADAAAQPRHARGRQAASANASSSSISWSAPARRRSWRCPRRGQSQPPAAGRAGDRRAAGRAGLKVAANLLAWPALQAQGLPARPELRDRNRDNEDAAGARLDRKLTRRRAGGH